MKIVKLSDICSFESGFAFSSEKFNREKGIGLIRIRDIKNGRDTATKYDGDYDERYIVRPGDYLIGMDGEFRCYEWKGADALLNQRVCKLVADKGRLDPRYFFYGINKYLKDIEDVTTFTTVKHISVRQIRDIDFPLPTLEAQRRAVASLDEAFEKIDDATKLTKLNLKNTQSLFDAKLKKLIESDHKNWESSPLMDITTKIGSGATPRGGKSAYQLEGISLIRSLNIYDLYFKYDKLAHINDEQANKLSNVTLESGDVLLNITGASVARCNIVPEDCLPGRVNQHVSIIRPIKDIILPEFLHYLLISDTHKKQLLGIGEGKGSTRQAITKTQIQEFTVSFPSTIEEQKAIVGRLNELLQSSQRLKEYYKHKIEMLATLKQSMLEQAFSDKVKE